MIKSKILKINFFMLIFGVLLFIGAKMLLPQLFFRGLMF